YFQFLRGRLFVVDLGSRAGMQLEGAEVSSGWFGPGQRLSLGPFHLKRAASPGASPLCPVPIAHPLDDSIAGQAGGAAASFDISQEGRLIARWRMNRVLSLVGSSTRCRVRLRDDSVSRVHCSFVATPHGVWVVDLVSREGTRLRGAAVPFARLEEGDV